MRVFHVTAPGQLELRETPPPVPGPGELLLSVRAALTCGTDLKLFRRGHPKMPFPTPIGHEFSGVVSATGPGCRHPVGTELMSVHTAPCERCALCARGLENLCDEAMASMTLGAFADSLLLPEPVVRLNSFVKPPELSFEHAAFLEPLACVVQGVDDIGVKAGDHVVILGAGPIGLLHLQLAQARGARSVVMVARRAARLEAARALGAHAVIDEQEGSAEDTRAAVLGATGGAGADVVIECAGQPAAWEQAVSFAARGGRVLWFGGCKPGTAVSLDTARIHYDQITTMGVFHFTPRAVAEAHRLIVEGEVRLAPLLSGRFPLEQFPEALDLMGRGEGVKYALIP